MSFDTLSIIVMVAIALLAIAVAFLFWRTRSPFGRFTRPRRHQHAGPVQREVHSLSTKGGGHGRPPDVCVYDIPNGTWRRVGYVDADGVLIGSPPEGDGLRLVAGKIYRIMIRCQRVAFRPERLVIGKGDSPHGAADWLVHNMIVGGRSQLMQSGALPGDMFAIDAADSFVTFETLQTGMDFCIDVSYQGTTAAEPFYGSIMGTAAI
jgi:hypothetical protein